MVVVLQLIMLKVMLLKFPAHNGTQITGKLYLNNINVNNVLENSSSSGGANNGNYVIKFAGQFFTTGDPNQTIAVPGMLSTDLVFLQVMAGGMHGEVESITPSSNSMLIHFPNIHQNTGFYYQVIRSIST